MVQTHQGTSVGALQTIQVHSTPGEPQDAYASTKQNTPYAPVLPQFPPRCEAIEPAR